MDSKLQKIRRKAATDLSEVKKLLHEVVRMGASSKELLDYVKEYVFSVIDLEDLFSLSKEIPEITKTRVVTDCLRALPSHYEDLPIKYCIKGYGDSPYEDAQVAVIAYNENINANQKRARLLDNYGWSFETTAVESDDSDPMKDAMMRDGLMEMDDLSHLIISRVVSKSCAHFSDEIMQTCKEVYETFNSRKVSQTSKLISFVFSLYGSVYQVQHETRVNSTCFALRLETDAEFNKRLSSDVSRKKAKETRQAKKAAEEKKKLKALLKKHPDVLEEMS